MKGPVISVILPVYNGIRYLNESVNSVLEQDFRDFEFLICDDRSMDGSYEYLCSLTDPRVRVFRNEQNMGLFYNLNFLAKQAKGPLIKLWSQDDVLEKNCFREIVAFHRKYPDISFSYTARHYIDENGKDWPADDLIDHTPEYIPKKLHDKIALFTGSIAGNIANVTIVKAKLFEVGLFDESMKIGGDFDMWVKLTEKYDIGKIILPLSRIRYHTGQLSRSPRHYIYHLKEDKKVYARLMERSDVRLQAFGKKCLRWRKNVLYFSFFMKAVRQKDWPVAKEFYRELREMDNIFLLGFRWGWTKLSRALVRKAPGDNLFLFTDS